MPTLHIQLFGDFRLVYGDTAVETFNQGRLQALLAYLTLHRHTPQPRQRLAYLFWPDSSEAQAHANLRQLLHRLQKALPQAEQFLQLDAKNVQWKAAAPFTLDVADFEQSLKTAQEAAAKNDQAGTRAALHSAVGCYGGDLLPTCYDEWLLPEREERQQAFLKALEMLIALAEAQLDYVKAIAYAQRLLRYDPLHETTYSRLMRLHALQGDRAAALRLYHTCATLLLRELGVEPNPQTRAFYEQLLNLEATPELPSHQERQHATQSAPRGEPLIGRRAEWQKLVAAWRMAGRGHARMVAAAGEAGIGKTRLAEELAAWVSRQGMRVAHTRAYAAEGALAYSPLAEWLRSEALRGGWRQLDRVWLTEVARILPELLVEEPHLPPPAPMTESWQRKQLFEALARALLADKRPLLLILDDLQWCDRETLEWLHYLLRYEPQARLLIAGTMRPEEVSADHPLTTLLLDLRSSGQVSEFELGPLNLEETAALAAQISGQALAADRAQRLFGETEGNPLFVVESAQMELAQGNGERRTAAESPSSPALTLLPQKVQAVIQRRLAHISPPARELASLAAVIGRSFTFAALAQTSGWAEDALARGLDELWQRRIIREQGIAAYDFSHDRIREVAYATITPALRRVLHQRVAQALAAIHGSDLDAVSAQIATHYHQAGLAERAIPYFQAAAALAQNTYVHLEAVDYLRKALSLLAQLPVTPELARQELALRLALATSLSTLKGSGGSEVTALYERAEALSREVGDPHQRLVALCGCFTSAQNDAQLQKARKLAEQCHTLAQKLENPRWLSETKGMVGVVSGWLGEWSTSRACLEEAVADANLQFHDPLTLFQEQHQYLTVRRHLAACLWYLGYPDQALAWANEAVALAQKAAHPSTLINSLIWSAWLHQRRREFRLTQIEAESAAILCQQHGLAHSLGLAMILEGWALAQQGQAAEGVLRIERGIVLRQAHQLQMPAFLVMLAESYGKAGEPERGVRAVAEALAKVEATGERLAEAELYRLKGELLQMHGAAAHEVESCFQQALALACRQSAKSLELRATINLARLWQRQGKQREACQSLSAIYSWFTEGFDTLDLQDARALLAELS